MASTGAPLSSAGLLNTATGYSGIGSAAELNSMLPVAFESQPAGWNSGPTVHLTATWFGGSIPPGGSAGPFVMASRGLPGIRRFVIRPSYDPDDFIKKGIDDPDVSNGDAQQIVDLDKAIQAAVRCDGNTVGPVQPASRTDAGQLINDLIALKHQAAAAHWIGSRQWIEDLDDRLSLAAKALSMGRESEARRVMERFVDALEQQWREQQGRHHDDDDERKNAKRGGGARFISANAYQLLKSNAEFVLSRLSARRGEKNDQHEAHRNGSDDR